MSRTGGCAPAALVAALVAASCARAVQAPAPTAAPLPASSPTQWQTRAAAYLDRRATGWVEHPLRVTAIKQNFDCSLTCHTTHPFVLARPLLPDSPQSLARVRGAIEARVSSIASWATVLPMYGDPEKPLGRAAIGAEAVMNASALAMGDQSLRRPPSQITLRAMDLMWAAQRDDGPWDWFDFELEPWEAGPDVGIALASLAVSSLPPDAVSGARDHID